MIPEWRSILKHPFAIGALCLFSSVTPARAEYRAYWLVLTNTQTNQTKEVLSTLDPLQYSGYYPLESNEAVTMKDTWMCRGRTEDFAEICPPPVRTPANAAQTPTTATP